ncbi:unnamed protein product [Ilex paraguariensis]|uniref:Uncharacterized protein n=1 Tax=Ilex paraguariensis TaxID=185542 RepID=A0ABC8SLZ3_9AQUA
MINHAPLVRVVFDPFRYSWLKKEFTVGLDLVSSPVSLAFFPIASYNSLRSVFPIFVTDPSVLLSRILK